MLHKMVYEMVYKMVYEKVYKMVYKMVYEMVYEMVYDSLCQWGLHAVIYTTVEAMAPLTVTVDTSGRIVNES